MSNQIDAAHYCVNSKLQKKIAIDIFNYHMFGKHENILDIGSGDGHITKLISQYGFTTGIDFSSSMVDFALENNQTSSTRFIEGDILTYSPMETYSLITAFNSIYWCGNLNAVFYKIQTLLKENGKFLIVTYPKESPYWSPIINLLKQSSWRCWLNESIYKDWVPSNTYKEIILNSGLSLCKFDTSIETITYNSAREYIDYIKGWLPLMFNNDKFPIHRFIVELVDSIWGNEKEKSINISYKKLVLYGAK